MKKLLKYFLYFLAFVFLVSIALVTPIDKTPYYELPIYEEINARLDSLNQNFQNQATGQLQIGYSKISITPADTVPLAGYSGRKPMEFEKILDSVFVRTLVMKTTTSKAAIISAELLIIHPGITSKLRLAAAELGWSNNEIYLNATHSHSSIGGWSPGYAGELVTGEYSEEQQDFIVAAMIRSLESASENLERASFGFANSELGMHVRNRLIKDGDEDAWVRNLFFKKDSSQISLTSYAAHATCFNAHSRSLTGDFPSYFFQNSDEESIYLSGAVGSMGPEVKGQNQKAARTIGQELANQLFDLNLLGVPVDSSISIQSFQVQVPLREPQLKVSRNIRIRPWLFNMLVGNYPIEVSVLKINNTLMIGMPCDFSGEVALPLYEYASANGLNLLITSFNGGYIGYVTKDEWYDLEKYETRTMNWYGPDSGAYFSEIVKRIIDSVKE